VLQTLTCAASERTHARNHPQTLTTRTPALSAPLPLPAPLAACIQHRARNGESASATITMRDIGFLAMDKYGMYATDVIMILCQIGANIAFMVTSPHAVITRHHTPISRVITHASSLAEPAALGPRGRSSRALLHRLLTPAYPSLVTPSLLTPICLPQSDASASSRHRRVRRATPPHPRARTRNPNAQAFIVSGFTEAIVPPDTSNAVTYDDICNGGGDEAKTTQVIALWLPGGGVGRGEA
jgi:hypothetical protein